MSEPLKACLCFATHARLLGLLLRCCSMLDPAHELRLPVALCCRCLAQISIYAVAPKQASKTDEGGWLRSLPLAVLCYEAIVGGALDWDYAPQSMLISQDGTLASVCWRLPGSRMPLPVAAVPGCWHVVCRLLDALHDDLLLTLCRCLCLLSGQA